MRFQSQRRSSAFSLVEVLVVLAIIGVLVALLLPAIQQAREAARRSQCANHLKQIGAALHAHHDARRVFPSGFVAEHGFPYASEKSGWGWAAFLLPYMEEESLYKRIDLSNFVFDDTGDATDALESNQDVAEQVLATFRCPTDNAPLTTDRGWSAPQKLIHVL